MKSQRVVLIVVIALLQIPIWIGNGSVFTLVRLHEQRDGLHATNVVLQQRNQALLADVVNLKSGLEAIEERARLELGMVKEGEYFVQVID